MKITPAKDYKKPLYAIGIAAAIMTVAVTGCGGQVSYAGDTQVQTQEAEATRFCKQDGDEVVLGGEAELPPDYFDETEKPTASLELSGAVGIIEPSETK